MTTLRLRKSIGRSPLRLALLLIPLALACFAFSPTARAVCQEGCLTNNNTVLGDDALLNNTGISNTAIGFSALRSNTFGLGNTALGSSTLSFNTDGESNTAVGGGALFRNTTGSDNTAVGVNALLSNTTADNNTAIGTTALFFNTGSGNTALGSAALDGNFTGDENTAIGTFALFRSVRGNRNIAVGSSAGMDVDHGSNNIEIGNRGMGSDNGAIRIGSRNTHNETYIAGISGAVVAGGVGVVIDRNGQLGTVVSSNRFKDDVEPMDNASEAILALAPVKFRYKKDLDPKGVPQFGLVAEEVEKVDPDLVGRDEQGKPYTVRYEAVNAMLLNEFLKEHRKVEALERSLAGQKQRIDALEAALKPRATRWQE